MPSSPTEIAWKAEFNTTALRYHTLIAWVAVFFNPIWAIGDYFNSPDHLEDFLIFRLIVSFLTFLGLTQRKRWSDKPHYIALIPFIGISIQNAYMYSVMDTAEIQKHTFAYIAMFIGAGMFVLWKPVYSWIVFVISLAANLVCFQLYGTLSVDEVLINGGLLTLSVALFTILLINTRTKLTIREIKSRLALIESYAELASKNKIIEEKNKDIRDSITYSQRIQQAILPARDNINEILSDYFVLYLPKDIVSGDFYWMTKLRTTPADPRQASRELVILAVVDCTGHGVPGALMSTIGSTILKQSATRPDINSPAEALNFLNYEITQNLTSIRDGMDIALVAIDFERLELQFAGANNPLYLIRDGKVIELKPDKQAIGADIDEAHTKTFTNHRLKLQKDDCIYLFTDGFADQFGGPNGKKFKYHMFRNTLLEIAHLPMNEQRKELHEKFRIWKGPLEQVDDICVLGLRV